MTIAAPKDHPKKEALLILRLAQNKEMSSAKSIIVLICFLFEL